VAPEAVEAKEPELKDSASKVPESGESTAPVEGDEKGAATEVKKSLEEPSKASSLHKSTCVCNSCELLASQPLS
jgi:hypothetical protein